MGDTRLFHKYQSRTFQFALDVLGALKKHGILSDQAVADIAEKDGLLYADQVMQALCSANIVQKTGQGVKIAASMNAFQIPPGQIELDYLQYILRLPEAAMFLNETLIKKLKAEDTNFFEAVQVIGAHGEKVPEYPGPDGFRLLLQAIRQGRLIRYSYRTRNDETLVEVTAQPWKVEYNAYDKRWWVILYVPAEDRTVKARLENLRNICLLEPSDIENEKIEDAVDRLLAPEPIVLEVSPEKGALERCFMVFENQLFTETSRTPNGEFEVEFRYYRFDESEIVRRLLYLGPMVTLKGPNILQKKMRAMIDSAMSI